MKNIRLQNPGLARDHFGHQNTNLDKICEAFNVIINTRGNSILVDGNPGDATLKDDVVRHQLVSNIIAAYEKKQKQN